MSIKDVEARLLPVLTACAYTHQSGSGYYTKVYSLQGGLQLIVGVDGHERIERVKGPEQKGRWFHLQWDPEESDVAEALGIATARIEEAARTPGIADDVLPPSPMGRPLSEARSVPVVLGQEGTKSLEVTSYGRYRTHRLVVLDFLELGAWRFHVEVDIDDNLVVPFKWKPTQADIQRARQISDPVARQFFGGARDFDIRGSGWFDLGPTRRILSLTYCRPEEFSELCYSVDIDMDNFSQVDYSLWGATK